MAEIVLIKPPVLPIDMDNRESRPPTGLLYVAVPVVQYGFDVVIIDQGAEDNWQEKLLGAVGKETICVGITCMTGFMILNGIETVKLIREYSNCPVVWGGVHPTLEPDTTISSEYVDIIVIGDGEETFLELAKALKNRESLESIDGIIYKKDGQIYKNRSRKTYDLNNLPPLPLNLVNMDHYKGHPQLAAFFHFKSPVAISLETSRGCAYKCTYCIMANSNFKDLSKWRCMSADKLIDYIENIIKEQGIKAFAFIDDHFFIDIRRVKRFLDQIEIRNLDIEWFADIRMDTIVNKLDIDFLKRLEKSGLRSLGIGIESGSNKILDYLQKGEVRETYIEANKMLASTKIVPQYGFIQGLPGETREDMEETYSLIATLLIDNPNAVPSLNKLLPTPNTPLFEDCVKQGFVPPTKFEEWAQYCDTGWDNGASEWMDKEAVEFRMSLSHFHDLINRSRRFRAEFNSRSFWDVTLYAASKILLYRLNKRNIRFLKLENIFYRFIIVPIYRVLHKIRTVFLFKRSCIQNN